MISRIQGRCLECFNLLPDDVRHTAEEKYRLWAADCFQASLHFQPLGREVWIMRINESYRALGKRYGGVIAWFWIGNHGEYAALSAGFQK